MPPCVNALQVGRWVAIGCPFAGAPGYTVDVLLTVSGALHARPLLGLHKVVPQTAGDQFFCSLAAAR